MQNRKEEYIEHINLKQNCLQRGNAKYEVLLDHFNIFKNYRFEQDTNPDDDSIIYEISS